MTAGLPLAVMAEVVNGYPFDSAEFQPTGVTPLVRIRDLSSPEYSVYLDQVVHDRWCIDDGDVVIGMDGDFNVVRWSRGRAALNQRLCRLRPRAGHDLRFVAYQLPLLLAQIRDTQFVTTVAHLSSEEVRQLRLVAPRVEEQRHIADFLDDQVARLDAAVARVNEIERQASERSQAALDALFDGSGSRVRCKDLLDHFPHYGVLVPQLVDEGVPFVRIKDLADLQLASKSSLAAIPLSQSAEYRRTVVRPGDVLVGVVGSTDKAAVVPKQLAGANIARAVARLVPASGVPSLVLLGWLGTTEYRRQAAAVTDADTAQPTLNMGDLRNFAVPLPAGSLQALAQDVERLRSWRHDAGTTSLRLRRLLEERKSALITACVTGEFDVSTASARAGDAAVAHLPAGVGVGPIGRTLQ
jgi:type I restriction enzyme S subunit